MSDANEALLASLIEIERYVSGAGWDQPVRLFALVPTAQLIASAPELADQLVVTAEDALSSIEQDDFPTGPDLAASLSRIAWPEQVAGVAIATERSFLPSDVENEIPTDPDAAATFVAEHPRREDVRVVVGVMRSGERSSLVRLASNPDELLTGDELVPGLADALAHTLEDE